MKIEVKRVQRDPGMTIGELYVDGVFQCYTCEDTEREGEPKVFGETAIPRGTYDITITFSPHFNRRLPLVNGVPGFDGVRIHPGNTAADTEGCILPGLVKAANGVGQSRAAFEPLMEKIENEIDKNNAVTLIVDVGEPRQE